MHTVTMDQVRAARHPTCVWAEEEMVAAIERRFPGASAIELKSLVDAWTYDPELDDPTLLQCLLLARRLLRPAGLPLRTAGPVQIISNPRAQLQQLSEAIAAAQAQPQPVAP